MRSSSWYCSIQNKVTQPWVMGTCHYETLSDAYRNIPSGYRSSMLADRSCFDPSSTSSDIDRSGPSRPQSKVSSRDKIINLLLLVELQLLPTIDPAASLQPFVCSIAFLCPLTHLSNHRGRWKTARTQRACFDGISCQVATTKRLGEMVTKGSWE